MEIPFARPLAALSVSFAVAVLACAALAQRSETGSSAFTPQERELLMAGELVRRPAARRERGGSYIGGTSYQYVRAPREAVWDAIVDASNYPRLIPGVDRAEVVQDRGSRRIMLLRHSYLFVRASYYAAVRIDRSEWTIHFELDPSRPHDVRDGRGFITVDRFRRHESIVTWGVMADVGSGIITGVFAPVIHDWILRVPWCVRGLVEARPERC